MDVLNIPQRFRRVLNNILNSRKVVNTDDVGMLVYMLKDLAKVSTNDYAAKAFLHDVKDLIIVLSTYAKHCSASRSMVHFTIREALGTVLCVIERSSINKSIAKKVHGIIEEILLPGNATVRMEVLRIYALILDKISSKDLYILAQRHGNFEKFNAVIDNTCDIETQAMILDVVLKFFMSNNSLDMGNSFLDIIRIIDTGSLTEKNMYQSIRMILDELNEGSNKIFSINCNSLKLNSRRVVEFEGSGAADDIWLDFNLLERKISFFCSPSFVCSINNFKSYPPGTAWEVFSFYVDDVDATFSYEAQSGTLNITIHLKTSVLSVFAGSNVGRTLELKICISRDSNRFPRLVQEILPKIFDQSVSAEFLGIDLRGGDSSGTVELIEDDVDSSPRIVHFEMKSRLSALDEPVVITLSDSDNDNEIVSIFSSQEKEKDGESVGRLSRVFQMSGTKHEIPIVERSTRRCVFDQEVPNEINTEVEKMSTSTKNVFNKSISPISFTESVFNRRARASPIISKKRGSGPLRARKTSTSLCKTDDSTKNQKMSTIKERKKKISSSLTINIPLQKSPEIKQNTSEDRSILTSIRDMNAKEQVLNLCYENDLNDNVDSLRVADWLRSINPVAPDDIFEDNNFFENRGEQPPELLHPSSQNQNSAMGELIVIPTSPVLLPEDLQVSQRSSYLSPEEEIELMMGSANDETSEVGVDNEVQENYCNSEYLLRMLSSEDKDDPKDGQESTKGSHNLDPVEKYIIGGPKDKQEIAKGSRHDLDTIERVTGAEKGVSVEIDQGKDSDDNVHSSGSAGVDKQEIDKNNRSDLASENLPVEPNMQSIDSDDPLSTLLVAREKTDLKSSKNEASPVRLVHETAQDSRRDLKSLENVPMEQKDGYLATDSDTDKLPLSKSRSATSRMLKDPVNQSSHTNKKAVLTVVENASNAKNESLGLEGSFRHNRSNELNENIPILSSDSENLTEKIPLYVRPSVSTGTDKQEIHKDSRSDLALQNVPVKQRHVNVETNTQSSDSDNPLSTLLVAREKTDKKSSKNEAGPMRYAKDSRRGLKSLENVPTEQKDVYVATDSDPDNAPLSKRAATSRRSKDPVTQSGHTNKKAVCRVVENAKNESLGLERSFRHNISNEPNENISTLSSISGNLTKKKRPLYNPGDCSGLSPLALTKSYIESRGDIEPGNPFNPDYACLLGPLSNKVKTVKQPKPEKCQDGKNNRRKVTQKKVRQETGKNKPTINKKFEAVAKIATKPCPKLLNVRRTGSFSKMCNDLKEKIRQEKASHRMQKRLIGKGESSSSSSSMEPWKIAFNKRRDEKQTAKKTSINNERSSLPNDDILFDNAETSGPADTFNTKSKSRKDGMSTAGPTSAPADDPNKISCKPCAKRQKTSINNERTTLPNDDILFDNPETSGPADTFNTKSKSRKDGMSIAGLTSAPADDPNKISCKPYAKRQKTSINNERTTLPNDDILFDNPETSGPADTFNTKSKSRKDGMSTAGPTSPPADDPNKISSEPCAKRQKHLLTDPDVMRMHEDARQSIKILSNVVIRPAQERAQCASKLCPELQKLQPLLHETVKTFNTCFTEMMRIMRDHSKNCSNCEMVMSEEARTLADSWETRKES